MRIVSFVPSWTETLLRAGANVVGRTRFCIHPHDKINSIAIVGGTKHADWQKVLALEPDLVLFDREENTKEMADACPVPWLATHVSAMQDMPRELEILSGHLALPELKSLAARWAKILECPPRPRELARPPALLEWKTPPPSNSSLPSRYVIWAHPWMCAGPDTFIGSMLKHFGWGAIGGASKYPHFDKNEGNTIYLCSTEPYPFAKKPDVLAELTGHIALVDGECLSWFGIRSLEFLERS